MSSEVVHYWKEILTLFKCLSVAVTFLKKTESIFFSSYHTTTSQKCYAIVAYLFWHWQPDNYIAYIQQSDGCTWKTMSCQQHKNANINQATLWKRQWDLYFKKINTSKVLNKTWWSKSKSFLIAHFNRYFACSTQRQETNKK